MKPLNRTIFGILSIVLISLSGCASIVSSSVSKVYVKTNPQKANVTITDHKGIEVFKGNSPAYVSLKTGGGYFKKAQYQVKISAPGYQEKIISINYKINGWYWGNILIGGAIGMLIVDPASGAMWKIANPVIDEKLDSSSPVSTKESELKIMDIANANDEMKSKMVRIE